MRTSRDRDELGYWPAPLGNHIALAPLGDTVHEIQTLRLELSGGNLAHDSLPQLVRFY
jgi:hypothetical protein